MEQYKKDLKLRLLTAFNAHDDDLLKEHNEAFDIQIAFFVNNCSLSDSELMAYYFLFKCEETYEIVQEKFEDCFEKHHEIDTIKTYGRRAIKRIMSNLHKDKNLGTWLRNRKRKN